MAVLPRPPTGSLWVFDRDRLMRIATFALCIAVLCICGFHRPNDYGPSLDANAIL
jgi:hypothetical protein